MAETNLQDLKSLLSKQRYKVRVLQDLVHTHKQILSDKNKELIFETEIKDILEEVVKKQEKALTKV